MERTPSASQPRTCTILTTKKTWGVLPTKRPCTEPVRTFLGKWCIHTPIRPTMSSKGRILNITYHEGYSISPIMKDTQYHPSWNSCTGIHSSAGHTALSCDQCFASAAAPPCLQLFKLLIVWFWILWSVSSSFSCVKFNGNRISWAKKPLDAKRPCNALHISHILQLLHSKPRQDHVESFLLGTSIGIAIFIWDSWIFPQWGQCQVHMTGFSIALDSIG